MEALEEFRANKEKYDLVITDYTMPKMTGTQLAKELISLRPDLPIILTSGYSQLIPTESLKQFGIQECIQKPFSSHDLCESIRRVLDKGKQDEA